MSEHPQQTRGGLCWVTQKEGVAVFDEPDLNSMCVIDPATFPNGTPIPVGTECRNEEYEAYRERLDDGVTLN